MYEKRYYQDECEYAIFNYFSKFSGNPVCALPTGTGKAVIIANFIKNVMQTWPNQRIAMITHVKELIEQNLNVLQNMWPNAPLGIHSDGLKQRDLANPVIYGSVQSIASSIKKEKQFGQFDIICIDEAHLVSPNDESRYQIVINTLKQANPNLKIIGFSATPYRMKQGLLTENGIFTDICYDITSLEHFNKLVAEGYLAPLISYQQKTKIDTSEVKVVAGEFNQKQLQEVSNKDAITYKCLQEAIEIGHNRNCWLVFTTGIEHAESVNDMLQSMGVDSVVCHSKLTADTNKESIESFKKGEVRALVNANKLTTGFDCPQIDLIIDLAATNSPGRHVQKLGRGTRPYPGKPNCQIADFAGNLERLGPINDVRLPRKKGDKKGDLPIRICDNCGGYNHAAARFCELCGMEFPRKSKLRQEASSAEAMRYDEAVIEYFNVQKVIYNRHEKKGKPPSIRVSYYCGLRMFNEWVCLEHEGFVRKRAIDWWRLRHAEDPPPTVDQALQKVSQLKVPEQVKVWVNKGKYPEILSVEF